MSTSLLTAGNSPGSSQHCPAVSPGPPSYTSPLLASCCNPQDTKCCCSSHTNLLFSSLHFCSFMFFLLPQTHVSPVLLVNSYWSFRLSSGEPFSRKPSPDSDPWTMSHISKMGFQTSPSMPLSQHGLYYIDMIILLRMGVQECIKVN